MNLMNSMYFVPMMLISFLLLIRQMKKIVEMSILQHIPMILSLHMRQKIPSLLQKMTLRQEL